MLALALKQRSAVHLLLYFLLRDVHDEALYFILFD